MSCTAQVGLSSAAALALQVVRCFDDDDVIHVAGKVDPVADIDVINFELALADIAQLEKRQERLNKGRAKSKEEESSQQARGGAAYGRAVYVLSSKL